MLSLPKRSGIEKNHSMYLLAVKALFDRAETENSCPVSAAELALAGLGSSGYISTILPGFMMFSGSRAALMAAIYRVASPSSCFK